ncbi:MAG: GNAT family N-acetyltransferase [Candidatus Limnocylindria bacterium]
MEVRDFEAADHDWAHVLIAAHAGGSPLIARLGEIIDPLTREGIVAETDGRPVGLLTVDESDRGLEVLTLHSETPNLGAGTRLLETAMRVASASEAHRLWLITTNDNLHAIRWYLRRGLTVATVHTDAVTRDRERVKPEIPERNPDNQIPLRDYVELELDVAESDALRFVRFPRIADIDALPPEAAGHVLAPLFEDAPRFLARLVKLRPFGDDATLIARAHDLARSVAEDEQIELLAAHPRIGADASEVSALSHAEQGYDDEDAPPAEPWIAEELETLNDAYERIFGFRYVIFVAGRPRSAIVPLIERALHDDRVGELRRGLDDVVYIAADRLATLRGQGAASIGA